MRITLGVATSLALAISLAPKSVQAQAGAQDPEFHYLTVTTFDVPLGADGQQVMMWIDSVMVPLAQLDPNVLSYRVGRHNWGSSAGQVIIVTEFASWEAIGADCGEPCETWTAENQPAEGTPEAEKWDAIQATFQKYYTGHRDEIYFLNMNRSK